MLNWSNILCGHKVDQSIHLPPKLIGMSPLLSSYHPFKNFHIQTAVFVWKVVRIWKQDCNDSIECGHISLVSRFIFKENKLDRQLSSDTRIIQTIVQDHLEVDNYASTGDLNNRICWKKPKNVVVWSILMNRFLSKQSYLNDVCLIEESLNISA